MQLSLRIKLTLVSFLLLFIPLLGLRFSDMIQKDLLESRKETMMFSARAVASTLTGNSGLLAREQFTSINPSRDLYLYPLQSPIRINGKNDDWALQSEKALVFGLEHLIYSKNKKPSDFFKFSHQLGIWTDYLYTIFDVTDKNIVYRQKNSLRLDLSDHLKISIEDQQGAIRHYIVTTDTPGWVNGFLMPQRETDPYPEKLEPNIQGMWVETDKGYTIELRMPMALVGKKMAFSISDVNDPAKRRIETIIGTANPSDKNKIGKAISPSRAIKDILQRLDRPHSRVFIIDSNRQVRASFGHLLDPKNLEITDSSGLLSRISSITYQLLTPLYQLFLKPFSTGTVTNQPTTLNLEGVDLALQGESTVTSYRPDKTTTEIMAAIVPLREDNTIIGAVVVEQTTNSILALQNKVIEESITLTILAFSLGVLGLLFFASRLSSRIRSLRDQAASAISNNGVITTSLKKVTTKDEIGDLSRTLDMMLRQIKEQNEYREKMADNLEHEMRTPLAGASASLKNLAQELDHPSERIQNYLDWAISDINRMEKILTAIRDATNLQEALQQDFKEVFDLDKALGVWLEHGWRTTFPETLFTYERPGEPCSIYGDPARIHQMLDKIIENGVAFHTPQTPIRLDLTHLGQTVELSISNQGPILSVEQSKQIFNSMVSIREKKDNLPHLGLGLFIVRTIIQHHDGRITASNLTGEHQGVQFTLSLPLHF